MFRLNKSSSGVSKNHKLITICLCTFGIPYGSQCVLGFAYNVIPMYCCIYVYIVGNVCASWGRCSRGPGYVRRGFSVSSLFSFRWMGLGSEDGENESRNVSEYYSNKVTWCMKDSALSLGLTLIILMWRIG